MLGSSSEYEPPASHKLNCQNVPYTYRSTRQSYVLQAPGPQPWRDLPLLRDLKANVVLHSRAAFSNVHASHTLGVEEGVHPRNRRFAKSTPIPHADHPIRYLHVVTLPSDAPLAITCSVPDG